MELSKETPILVSNGLTHVRLSNIFKSYQYCSRREKKMNLFSTQFLSLPRDGYMSSARDIMGNWSYVMVFAVILLLWFSSIIHTVFFHPLSRVPGPWLATFSEAWRSHKYFRGTWHQDVVLLHRKYGNVVRIAPNELSIVDEAGLKALYGHGQKVVKVRNLSLNQKLVNL